MAILSKRVQAVRRRVRKKKKKKRGVSHIGRGEVSIEGWEGFKPSAYYEGILSHFHFYQNRPFTGSRM